MTSRRLFIFGLGGSYFKGLFTEFQKIYEPLSAYSLQFRSCPQEHHVKDLFFQITDLYISNDPDHAYFDKLLVCSAVEVEHAE